MPLSFDTLNLLGRPDQSDSFRCDPQDFSQEYFRRVKANQTSLGRTYSTVSSQSKVTFNGPNSRPVLPDSISGLFNDVDKHYDLFSNSRRRQKPKRTRSLGLNTDRYNAVLHNGPWDVLNQRTEKTRREAARKLIEDELKRRQQESVLGTASLPKLSTERVIVSSGIAEDNDTTESGVFYARDLLHAPQIVANKKTNTSRSKKPAQDHEVDFRLPSLTGENTREKASDKAKSQRREKLRQEVRERLDPTHKSKENVKLPNPNWVTVISPVRSPSSPLAIVPELDESHTTNDDVMTSSARETPENDSKPNQLRRRSSQSSRSESRSEIMTPLLSTIAESPETSTRNTPLSSARVRSSDQPRSILKSRSSDEKNNSKTVRFLENDSKTVRFLDTAYLERIRMFHIKHSQVQSSSVSPTTSPSDMSANTNKSSEVVSSGSSVPTLPVIRLDPSTHTSESTDSTDGKTTLPPWRALAQMIKSKTRIKRKRKKLKKKNNSNLSTRPDSPRPGFLSGQTPVSDPPGGQQLQLDSKTEPETKTNDDTAPDEVQDDPYTRRLRQNRGDGFVIKLKGNGDLVEEKVADDEISGYVTDAELSYHIQKILARPVFASSLKPSPPKSDESKIQDKNQESVEKPPPRKIGITALRRKSLPPTCAPFLAPEFRAPENSPFVSACVNWSGSLRRNIKGSKVASEEKVIIDDDLEISPLLLAMRDCRYIRWAKKDEIIVEKLLDLEDQLMESPNEEVEVLLNSVKEVKNVLFIR